jgi:hypothetical protein
MSYGDEITTPSHYEAGAEDDDFGPDEYESAAEFDSEDELDWDEDDEIKR